MAVNKIIYNGQTLLDISADTITSGTALSPATAHDGGGNAITGSVETVQAGTPTATKGTVSNHSVSITPTVTNPSGYITGGTKLGTAVSVSASELVSGTLNVTENGTTPCVNYASVSVSVPYVSYYTGTGEPSASLGSDGDLYFQLS